MCTPTNLRLIFMALTLLKGCQMIFMFSFGLIVALDIKLHQAFGTHIEATGIGVALMGVYGSINMSIGLKGSFLHNKFLLLVHLILDVIALFIQVGLAYQLIVVTFPEFDEYTRNTCAQSNPEPLDAVEDCIPYLQSERVSGFQIVWRSYYYESGQDATYYQKIIDLQRNGQCCGFGPPKRCIQYEADMYPDVFPHKNKFDGFYKLETGSPDDGWEAYVANRQLCDYLGKGLDNDNWYPKYPLVADTTSEAEECYQVIDVLEVPPVYGGCLYEMPLGTCKDVRELNVYSGCVANMENALSSELAPPAVVVLGMSILQVLAIIASCCNCWKRKQHDTFPDTLTNIPYNPYKKNVDVSGILEKQIHRPRHEEPGIEFIED
jgi:hypothetical protein